MSEIEEPRICPACVAYNFRLALCARHEAQTKDTLAAYRDGIRDSELVAAQAEIVRLRAALVKVETAAMGLIEVAKTESEETAFTRYAISRGRMIRDAAAAALNLLAALAPARQDGQTP